MLNVPLIWDECTHDVLLRYEPVLNKAPAVFGDKITKLKYMEKVPRHPLKILHMVNVSGHWCWMDTKSQVTRHAHK